MGRAREGRVDRTSLLLLVLLAAPGCWPAAPGDSPAGGEEAIGGRETGGAPPGAPSSGAVLSLLPAATGLVVELGAAGRLVGRVEEDAHPDVQGLPSVGSLIGPNTEAVLRLNPDIIIAPAGDLPVWAIGRVRPIQARLRPLSLGRLADQPRALRELGGWLGTESRADSVAEHLEAGFEAASGRAAEGPAVPVLWLVGDAPVLAVGAESLQADLLSLAGGLNVAEAAGAPFVPADPTLHLAADPLVVLWSGHPLDPTAGSASAAVRSAGLGSLSAVRNGRLFTLPRDFLEPSGSRSLQVIDSLFQMLHPTPAETPGAGSTRF